MNPNHYTRRYARLWLFALATLVVYWGCRAAWRVVEWLF